MGEAWSPAQEYVICVLPFEKTSQVDGVLADIKQKHPQVEFEYHHVVFNGAWKDNDHEVSDESWARCTILVTLASLPPDLKACKNLKLVHLFSAGANHLSQSDLWKHSNIPITNSSGVHGPQIAEWVIMQILTNSHKEKLLLEWQKKHIWGKHADIGFVTDAVGQRLGVLGYGAIGRQTARISKAMGMDVIAYTAGPRNTPESKKDHTYTVPGTGDPDGLIPSAWYSGLDTPSLHNFLTQDIDILLISVPLTPQTHHFLSSPEFALLSKKKAFIVNIARGQIVDQEALISSLKKKELRGAALDVTDPEPLGEDSELWDLENVTVTPHVSGLGTMYLTRSFEILERNLGAFERGAKLINVVDKKKGY